MSYMENLRKKLAEQQQKASNNQNNNGQSDIYFVPPVGTTKIRILPPIDENDLFYHSHSYNYLKSSSTEINEDTGAPRDKMLFSAKYFYVDGKRVKNPIDDFVAKLYNTKNDANMKIGSSIKRKRRYYANILLLDTESGDPEYRILVDNSNEGKLIRLICAQCGIPFVRDIEDNWIDKDFTPDPDKEVFDLVDIKKGHDFKINKEKTGEDNWAITYEKSFVITKPRALNEKELALLDERKNLRDIVEYVNDYDEVVAYLDRFIENNDYQADVLLSQVSPEKKESKALVGAGATKKAPKVLEDAELDENALREMMEE